MTEVSNIGEPDDPGIQRPRVVAVIGDGLLSPDAPKYTLAREIGHGLVDSGFAVLTGGLGGVMEAALRGARESAAWRSGLTIALLPGDDPERANPYADVAIPTGLGHLRNALVARADAVIAVGGGAGTLAEIAFAWIHARLIVGLRVDGWSSKLADQRVDDVIRYREIPEDRVFGASDARDAVRIVRERIEAYRRS